MPTFQEFGQKIGQCDIITDCAWYGSYVQGKTTNSISDYDIVLKIRDTQKGRKFNLPDRMQDMAELKFTENFCEITHEGNTLPTSLLIITGRELRWDIVKNVPKYEFFTKFAKKTLAILKGDSESFAPDKNLEHIIKFMNHKKGVWDQYASIISRTQLLRAKYCRNELDNNEAKIQFKGLCRLLDTLEGGEDQDRGYQSLIGISNRCRNSDLDYFFNQHKTYQDGIKNIDQLLVMQVCELSCSDALDELDKILPSPDDVVSRIFKNFWDQANDAQVKS